ncbi:MAG: peptidoglycan endopeptidase [Chloroflexota bacterium]|nr:MAG: peptidoglycan endopeptidase [Chloroflexota bacterium]
MQSLPSKKVEINWHSVSVRWITVAAVVASGFGFAMARGSASQPASAMQQSDQLVMAASTDRAIIPPTQSADAAPTAVPTPVQPSPTPVASPTSASARTAVITHAVQDGDTLSDLADKYGVSVDTILWANNLANDFLQIDQQLLIPPVSGVLYTVKEGDNIREIASTYQVETRDIVNANQLSNADALESGSKLILPGARPVEASRLMVAVRGGERQSELVARRSGITTYEVADGDTLNAIASKFDVTVSTIVSANSIPDPDNLTPGQKLLVPATLGVLHTVQEGDSVVWIAARNGVSVESIVAANSLSSPDRIKPGDHILIPSPTAASGGALVVTAAAPVQRATQSSYTVQPGDTLLAIAYRLDAELDRIAQANGLSEPYFLRDGQVLQIPGGNGQSASSGSAAAGKKTKHVVVPGDTVFGLSVSTRVSQDSIIALNGLQPPYVLQIGQELVIPAGSGDEPAPAPRSAPKPAAPPAPARAAAPAPAPAAPAAPAPASSLGQRIADLALQYRGYRYTWGGISPSTGFDCSGFVYYIYRQAGVPIPRDLFGQLNAGRRVSRSELQPGDIVFFANTYAAGLSHDGIYVGGGRFINANNENVGVIINSLGESYWGSRYYAASRPGS